MRQQLKTKGQLRAIFGLGRKRGLNKEDLEEIACDVTQGRIVRLSALNFNDANAVIEHLGGDGFARFVPRRTQNYRKQIAGVVTLVSPAALEKMDDLAAIRGISKEGLERMCLRMIKRERPITALKCAKIIEALKAMIARDALQAKGGRK